MADVEWSCLPVLCLLIVESQNWPLSISVALFVGSVLRQTEYSESMSKGSETLCAKCPVHPSHLDPEHITYFKEPGGIEIFLYLLCHTACGQSIKEASGRMEGMQLSLGKECHTVCMWCWGWSPSPHACYWAMSPAQTPVFWNKSFYHKPWVSQSLCPSPWLVFDVKDRTFCPMSILVTVLAN